VEKTSSNINSGVAASDDDVSDRYVTSLFSYTSSSTRCRGNRIIIIIIDHLRRHARYYQIDRLYREDDQANPLLCAQLDVIYVTQIMVHKGHERLARNYL